MNEKQKAYERFKLQWMLDHGYTLTDLVEELDRIREDYDPDESFLSIFESWEFDQGFGSEIWPCYDEWLECKYKEEMLR